VASEPPSAKSFPPPWLKPLVTPLETLRFCLHQVDDVCADQAHVTLVDPLVCSEPSVPREVIEAQLDELDYTLDIVELYPVTILDDDDDDDSDENEDDGDGASSEARVSRLEQKLKEEVHQKRIAQIVDNARYVVFCLGVAGGVCVCV